MGNNICCYNSPHIEDRGDALIDEDSLQKSLTHNANEYDKIEDHSEVSDLEEKNDVANEQDTRHHRQGSNQEPKHMDSLSELEDSEDNGVLERVENELSDLDGSTDDSISPLEDVLVVDLVIHQPKEEKISHRESEEGSYQHQRKSSAQISLELQTLEVSGAGNPAVNGVYRWFAAHERFVMFTDQGQYQIMGGVDLSEYGECYYNSWVIEEITGTRLYAVPLDERSSISSEGWICIDGASPAPKVKGGEERELFDEEYDMETEESDSSLSHLPTAYLPKQWVASNSDELGGVNWVD